jgi:hypothetical protein
MSNSTKVDYEPVMKALRAAEERITSGDGHHGRCDFGRALLDYHKDSGRRQLPSDLLNRISSELNVPRTVVNKRIEHARATDPLTAGPRGWSTPARKSSLLPSRAVNHQPRSCQHRLWTLRSSARSTKPRPAPTPNAHGRSWATRPGTTTAIASSAGRG